MKWAATIFGALILLLGALWFLQGTGLVIIDPIACVGECGALTGPNAGWTLAGLGTMLVAAALLWWALRRIVYRN